MHENIKQVFKRIDIGLSASMLLLLNNCTIHLHLTPRAKVVSGLTRDNGVFLWSRTGLWLPTGLAYVAVNTAKCPTAWKFNVTHQSSGLSQLNAAMFKQPSDTPLTTLHPASDISSMHFLWIPFISTRPDLGRNIQLYQFDCIPTVKLI